MGLPTGWVTDGAELTQNQQIIALGNGVLPLQAVVALSMLREIWQTLRTSYEVTSCINSV